MARDKGYRTVRGRLGAFGWASRVLLIGWNIAMLAWVVTAGGVASDASSLGEKAGAGIGIMMIVIIWVAGTVIIGIWALLTRPPKTLVPIEED